MSALDAPSAARVRASFVDPTELDGFVETLGRYERREIDTDAWRAYRVTLGAYSQRQDGVHMLRVKIPQGIATAEQLRALADITARYSRGFGHVTTRQNFQAHFINPADILPALRRLADAGITTSGAGGSTVRNVVTCPFAGISPDEPFDPTPYAEAMTRHFLRHPLAYSLPRKFKVAFEGCTTADHAGTAIQDLGLRAIVRDDGGITRRGFAVTIAGGTSSACTAGSLLVAFLPAGDVLALGEAIIRVFHARGDRKNRHKNRLKFLVKELGFDAIRASVEESLEAVRREGAPALPFDPERPPVEHAPRHERPEPPTIQAIAERVRTAPLRGPGAIPPVEPDAAPSAEALEVFVRTNTRPQRQEGYRVVTIATPRGDVTAAQLEALADLSLSYGDGSIRLGSAGHLVLRWVREADVAPLYAGLAAAGLGRDGVGSAADVVSCPGAEACRLAVTRTREIAQSIDERVRTMGHPALSAEVSMHVSGCPNGCSQHHISAIGLQGSARRVGGRTVPQYFVLLGGSSAPGTATFGRVAAKIPARRVADAVERLVSFYLSERQPGEAAGPFFVRSFGEAKALLGPLETMGPEDVRAEDLIELGASEEFRPQTQEGECAA